MKFLAILCFFYFLAAQVPVFSAVVSTSHRVKHYAVSIVPNWHDRSIVGTLKLDLEFVSVSTTKSQQAFAEQLVLDVGELVIDTVEFAGLPLETQRSGSRLSIALVDIKKTSILSPTSPQTITLQYHGKPNRGLVFLPQHQQIFASFDTSHWMPCMASPLVRASFELTMLLPSSFAMVANGEAISKTTLNDGNTVHRWRQAEARPCYLYGFAAGNFIETNKQSGASVLRYLTPPTWTESEIHTVFAETASMLKFYEQKSGKAYPAATYTQVLVSAAAAQELDGFAILSEKYGRRVLADPTKHWIFSHELSHQWWGNQVTNHAWTEMWLNEGVASFLNAAYIEHRYGRAQYEKQIHASKIAYYKLRAEALDKPLIFETWDTPTASDRSLVYDKGSYVLHRLREELGDKLFWKGIRLYTSRFWGKSVRSKDLQDCMEKASQRRLDRFFNTWVYALPPS